MSAERKYTDRDVRGNDELHEAAIEYLEQYTGEFEYLIDMKMRVASGRTLTVAMVRGVLNCMRHDPRVTNLPEPKPAEYGVVIDMEEHIPRRRESRPKFMGTQLCDRAEPNIYPETFELHDEHDWTTANGKFTYRCPGAYDINRAYEVENGYESTDYEFAARIKVPYAAARGGKLIHSIAPGSPSQSVFVWSARRHSWGYYRVRLVVKTVCKYPSYLTDPYLLTEEQANKLIDREPCPHCMEEA